MADMGWARSNGTRAEKEGLRRGAWYRIVEDHGKDWVVLDVHQVEVRVPRDNVQVRKERPKSWSAQGREMYGVWQQLRGGLDRSGMRAIA